MTTYFQNYTRLTCFRKSTWWQRLVRSKLLEKGYNRFHWWACFAQIGILKPIWFRRKVIKQPNPLLSLLFWPVSIVNTQLNISEGVRSGPLNYQRSFGCEKFAIDISSIQNFQSHHTTKMRKWQKRPKISNI